MTAGSPLEARADSIPDHRQAETDQQRHRDIQEWLNLALNPDAVHRPHQEPRDQNGLEHDGERGRDEQLMARFGNRHRGGHDGQEEGLQAIETDGREERLLTDHEVDAHQHPGGGENQHICGHQQDSQESDRQRQKRETQRNRHEFWNPKQTQLRVGAFHDRDGDCEHEHFADPRDDAHQQGRWRGAGRDAHRQEQIHQQREIQELFDGRAHSTRARSGPAYSRTIAS